MVMVMVVDFSVLIFCRRRRQRCTRVGSTVGEASVVLRRARETDRGRGLGPEWIPVGLRLRRPLGENLGSPQTAQCISYPISFYPGCGCGCSCCSPFFLLLAVHISSQRTRPSFQVYDIKRAQTRGWVVISSSLLLSIIHVKYPFIPLPPDIPFSFSTT